MSRTRHNVVGVDGSDCSRVARRWACAEAAHDQARLTVVAVWPPPLPPMEPAYGPPYQAGRRRAGRWGLVHAGRRSRRGRDPRRCQGDVEGGGRQPRARAHQSIRGRRPAGGGLTGARRLLRAAAGLGQPERVRAPQVHGRGGPVAPADRGAREMFAGLSIDWLHQLRRGPS
jgi:nucleotide-binding universal stress UspA family protein